MRILEQYEDVLELSAERMVLETLLFQVPGSFETLGSKLSLGTSEKFADVRTHLRKVSNKFVSLILNYCLIKCKPICL